MENEGRQMPEHIKLAYDDAVQNVMFFKRQQWVATNYAVLVYAALFVISAEYFSRTDFARNWLGIFAIATFIFHLYVLYSFDVAISKFREGLDWIYRNYFTGVEQTNLKLRELRPSVGRRPSRRGGCAARPGLPCGQSNSSRRPPSGGQRSAGRGARAAQRSGRRAPTQTPTIPQSSSEASDARTMKTALAASIDHIR